MDDDQELSVKEAELDYLRKYTVEEWLSWDEGFRSELHDGTLVVMAQPIQKHQEALGEIFHQLYTFLKGKTCKVFLAPFGVRLSKHEHTAFEPDVVVVCDKEKLDGKICNGAPDLVVEVLSPSTARIDRKYKYIKYQQAGVREYWIVDLDLGLLQVGVLVGGAYVTSVYDADDTVKVHVLDGCEIVLADVFAVE